MFQTVQLLCCVDTRVLTTLLANDQQQKELKAALQALSDLVRSDYSFSDYGLGKDFYSLSLFQDPFTLDAAVSKQMLKDIALKPLYETFVMAKTLRFMSQSLSPGDAQSRGNFTSLLLANVTPGVPSSHR